MADQWSVPAAPSANALHRAAHQVACAETSIFPGHPPNLLYMPERSCQGFGPGARSLTLARGSRGSCCPCPQSMTRRSSELCPLGKPLLRGWVFRAPVAEVPRALSTTRVHRDHGERAGLRLGASCGTARFTATGARGSVGSGQVSGAEAGRHPRRQTPRRASTRIPLGPWRLGTDLNSDSSSYTRAWSTEKMFPASGNMWALSKAPTCLFCLFWLGS